MNGEGEGRRVIQVVFVLLALVAGAAATVQFAVNAELRGAVDSPILASLSFLVGTVALFRRFLTQPARDTGSHGLDGGAVVVVSRWVSRGIFCDLLDNPHPEARGSEHGVLHPSRPDLRLDLA